MHVSSDYPSISNHGHADDETTEKGKMDRETSGNIPGKSKKIKQAC
jgi:hypothetical protein